MKGSKELLAHLQSCASNRFDEKLKTIESPHAFVAALGRYFFLNTRIVAGLLNLTDEILGRGELFRDPREQIEELADASYEVANGIFIAVTDELTARRKRRHSHRRLALATLKAIADGLGLGDREHLHELLRHDHETMDVGIAIEEQFGVGKTLDDEGLFRAIGFHVAQEYFGGAEALALERFIAEKWPTLAENLKKTSVKIARVTIKAGDYLDIHTVVEEEHFLAALHTFDRAARCYTGCLGQEQITTDAKEGVTAFLRLQEKFI